MHKPWPSKAVAMMVLAGAAVLLTACGGGSASGGKKGQKKDEGPIPVDVATVQQQDVPVYLEGLGTVQAFNTATIRAQVSGRLVAVPFKEGDEIKAGDVIARIDPRTYQATLDQALAKLAQDQATLHSAQLDLKRYQDLVPQGYVSQQQVDQQKATVEQTQALIKADQAAIESDRVQLSYCTITAPFDGIAGIRQVDIGNLVSSSDASGIVTLTQIKPIAINFTLPEQALSQIHAVDVKAMTVLAIDRNNQQELAHGELMAVDNQIDQTTGTIKLKARFSNEEQRLWPGQFINVRLLVRTADNALTIPAQAVQMGPQGSFVYVVDDQHKAQVRAVTPGQIEGGIVLIDKGLKAGETVVVDGQSRLTPGAAIQVGDGSAVNNDAKDAAAASGKPPSAAGRDAKPSGDAAPSGAKP